MKTLKLAGKYFKKLFNLSFLDEECHICDSDYFMTAFELMNHMDSHPYCLYHKIGFVYLNRVYSYWWRYIAIDYKNNKSIAHHGIYKENSPLYI